MCCFVPAVAVSFFLCVCTSCISTLEDQLDVKRSNGWNLKSDIRYPVGSEPSRCKCQCHHMHGAKMPWFQRTKYDSTIYQKKHSPLNPDLKTSIFLFLGSIYLQVNGTWLQTKCWKQNKDTDAEKCFGKHSNDSERIEKKTPTNCFMVSTYLN